MADDLDDQLEYSFDVSVPEGAELTVNELEEVVTAEKRQLSDVEDEQPTIKSKKKRKADKGNNSGLHQKKQLRMQQETEQRQNLGSLEPGFIADYILSKLKAGNSELSTLELQDRGVPESQIIDTSKFSPERTLESLPQFLTEYKLDTQPKDNSLTLVLCMSAIRVCDVARALRGTQGGALKLITKNKPDYDKKALASPTFIAVSTPGRARKLVSLGLLDLDRVKTVIIDSSFLDMKKNNVWELVETIPLVSELAKTQRKVYVY